MYCVVLVILKFDTGDQSERNIKLEMWLYNAAVLSTVKYLFLYVTEQCFANAIRAEARARKKNGQDNSGKN